MWLTDLAVACHKSGLRVVQEPGWQDRGHGPMTSVSSITCHHTATRSVVAGDYPTLRVVRDGTTGLTGPLSQLGLGRDGTVYVIAAGLSYHAGVTHQPWQGNAHAIGIEAEHPGGGTPWPKTQYDAYTRLCAALTLYYRVPVDRVLGHKEIAKPAGRKSDPTFDMTVFRAQVAALHPKPAPPVPDPKKRAPEMFVTRYGSTGYRLVTGDRIVGLSKTSFDRLTAAGVVSVALDNTEVAALEKSLVAEISPEHTTTEGTP